MKEGWEYKTFKDQFSINMGKTPPRGDSSSWDKSKITTNKWVTIADISLNEGKIIFDTKEYISDKAAEKIKKVKAGSLLMSFKLTIGKMAFAGDDLFTNEAIIAIPQNEDYDLHFLYYYLLQYDWRTLTEGNEKVKGATLNKQSIGKILLPIIPIDEQRSIVSYLDSSFTLIDEIKNKALKSLTEAKALFQSALAEAMEPKEGWEEKTLGEIATEMYRGSGIKRDQITPIGFPCLRYGEIYTTYNYSFSECISHTNESVISPKKYFEKGDILFAITGESVEDIGKCIAYTGKEKCLLGGDIVAMKHNQYPQFLAYALSTKEAIRQKGLGKVKLKVVHTNIPALKTIRIYLPNIPTQKQIVSRLDKLSSKVRAIEEKYQKMVDECDALKQAMLRDVFE